MLVMDQIFQKGPQGKKSQVGNKTDGFLDCAYIAIKLYFDYVFMGPCGIVWHLGQLSYVYKWKLC